MLKVKRLLRKQYNFTRIKYMENQIKKYKILNQKL